MLEYCRQLSEPNIYNIHSWMTAHRLVVFITDTYNCGHVDHVVVYPLLPAYWGVRYNGHVGSSLPPFSYLLWSIVTFDDGE